MDSRILLELVGEKGSIVLYGRSVLLSDYCKDGITVQVPSQKSGIISDTNNTIIPTIARTTYRMTE